MAVVVKHGSDGATVHTPTGSHSHPGFVVDPVDLTGAGDAFAAGFLASLVSRDDNVLGESASTTAASEYADALAVGNACGGLAARDVTARTELSWAALEALLDTDPA